MKILKNARGFTLLEVLIVLVILAVLAGLAIPAYQAAIEKSRSQEALTSLTAAREAMVRYFAINNTYVGAAFGVGAMDYNPNLAVGGQTLLYTYTFNPVSTATTFTVRATRTALTAADFVSLDQAGAVVRSGVYA